MESHQGRVERTRSSWLRVRKMSLIAAYVGEEAVVVGVISMRLPVPPKDIEYFRDPDLAPVIPLANLPQLDRQPTNSDKTPDGVSNGRNP